MTKPLFTIGVTTYNRCEMLKECLNSLQSQTFSDFEVIVGNNYTSEVLTPDSLGFTDSRMTIVNHPSDLGQCGNMNDLLSRAKGRYFSWLADDDLFEPQFLEAIKVTIDRFSDPECVFCAYNKGAKYIPGPATEPHEHTKLINGADFLERYLSQDLDVLGVYGGFQTEYLRGIGGITQLGDGFGPYSDTLLAIRAGGLDKVAYIDTPLIFFRTHDQSISYTSPDMVSYTTAQMELISRCNGIFTKKKLLKYYQRNMYQLLMWCSRDIYVVLRRNSFFLPRGIVGHLKMLVLRTQGIGWLYIKYVFLNILYSLRYIARSLLPRRSRDMRASEENI